MRLHSAYNPQREAQKYIDSLDISKAVDCFILIECGQGYVIPVLREKYPCAKIISLHIWDEFLFQANKAEDSGKCPDAQWSPASGLGCQEFLEQHIEDTKAEHIKIIEWRLAFMRDSQQYLALLSETAAFIKRCDANKRTIDAFQGRWRKNILKNVRLFAQKAAQTQRILPTVNTQDLIICAAGPSLETQIETIRSFRSKRYCAVLAVSSAVAALNGRGIPPDIVFTSDGGNWARLHLFEVLRCRTKKILIAAALNAALLPDFKDFPLLLFGDGSAYQNEILRRFSLPLIALPQRGTVTAAALDFALGWTAGSIYLTGADLDSGSLSSHARPYALDTLFQQKHSRFAPYYQLKWERNRSIKKGESYKIYAGWFKQQANSYPARIFSLGNNHPAFGFKSG